MQIKSIQIDNVRNLERCALVGLGGCVGLSARNGCGKSNLLSSIYYTLTGLGLFNEKQETFLNRLGGGVASCTLEIINDDGQELTVRRRIERTAEGGSSSLLEVKRDNYFLVMSQKELTALLGFSSDTLLRTALDPLYLIDLLESSKWKEARNFLLKSFNLDEPLLILDELEAIGKTKTAKKAGLKALKSMMKEGEQGGSCPMCGNAFNKDYFLKKIEVVGAEITRLEEEEEIKKMSAEEAFKQAETALNEALKLSGYQVLVTADNCTIESANGVSLKRISTAQRIALGATLAHRLMTDIKSYPILIDEGATLDDITLEGLKELGQLILTKPSSDNYIKAENL